MIKKLLFLLFLFAIAVCSVKAQDTIYFDAHGKRLATVDSAVYKSVTVVDSSDASLFLRKNYWITGQIRKEYRYKIINGNPLYIGKYYEWHQNGALKSEVTYVDGKKEGDEMVYDENKKMIEHQVYSKGNIVKVFDENGEEGVFVEVEKMPEYQGGAEALNKFLIENLRYTLADENAVYAELVILRLLICSDGRILSVQLLKGLSSDINADVVKVVGLMPRWIPGMQGGRRVNVWYNLPIRFQSSR